MTGETPITFLTRERFEAKPQVGLPIVQEWHPLLRWLTWPSFADDKRAHGAWCPAVLPGGAVKGGRGPVSLIVADVDDTDGEGLDRSASALVRYVGAVIPTFSATREKQKHRIVLRPSRELSPDEFTLVWPVMARTLETAGIVVDKGCKNVNRLYFACVARSPATWLGAHILTGDPVPVDAMLDVARKLAAEADEQRRNRPAPLPVSELHRDRYVSAAVNHARANIMAAPEGGRHDALLKEAFSLARLDGLSEWQIADALLGPFVSVAGEARRREGERAIRDAVNARQGAAQ